MFLTAELHGLDRSTVSAMSLAPSREFATVQPDFTANRWGCHLGHLDGFCNEVIFLDRIRCNLSVYIFSIARSTLRPNVIPKAFSPLLSASRNRRTPRKRTPSQIANWCPPSPRPPAHRRSRPAEETLLLPTLEISHFQFQQLTPSPPGSCVDVSCADAGK
eukprot:3139118-Rhodomonas_salina.3